jgi:predicted RNA methylase
LNNAGFSPSGGFQVTLSCLLDVGCSVGMWSIAAQTCGAKKVYGFDPLIENKVANDDRFVRYNWKIENFAERVDTFSYKNRC